MCRLQLIHIFLLALVTGLPAQQANSPGASLVTSEAMRMLRGGLPPYESVRIVPGTLPFELRSHPSQLMVVVHGTLASQGLPTPMGIIELDITQPLQPLPLGSGGSIPMGVDGRFSLDIPFEAQASTTLADLQAYATDPTSPYGISFSSANRLSVEPGAAVSAPFASNGSVHVPLTTFTFPFYGTSYSELYVNANGNLSFGSPSSDWSESPVEWTTGEPRIALFWDELDPQADGGICINEVDGRLSVRWLGVPEAGATQGNSGAIQLAQDGGIALGWDRLGVGLQDALVGITPGSSTLAGTSLNLGAASYAGGPHEALFEHFTPASPFDLTGAALNFRPTGTDSYDVVPEVDSTLVSIPSVVAAGADLEITITPPLEGGWITYYDYEIEDSSGKIVLTGTTDDLDNAKAKITEPGVYIVHWWLRYVHLTQDRTLTLTGHMEVTQE